MTDTPQENNLNSTFDPVIRLPRVLELTGCSRAFIYQQIKENNFPKGIALGKKARGWRLSSINQWLDEREADSQGEAA